MIWSPAQRDQTPPWSSFYTLVIIIPEKSQVSNGITMCHQMSISPIPQASPGSPGSIWVPCHAAGLPLLAGEPGRVPVGDPGKGLGTSASSEEWPYPIKWPWKILEIYKNHTKISEIGRHRCHRFIYIYTYVYYIYIEMLSIFSMKWPVVGIPATTGWPCKEPRLSLVVWIDNLGWPPGCRVDS